MSNNFTANKTREFQNHHVNANDAWYEALNDTPGRVGPPIERPSDSIAQYYHEWLDRDGYPWWPFWDGGAQTFIDKGTNGCWRDVLQQNEIEKYEHLADRELSQDCAHWLSTGEIT